MDSTLKKLKLFYQNVRGLRTKTNTFYNNVLLADSDVILVTETWLHDGVLDAELCNGEFKVFRNDRPSLGGGVMLLCRSGLNARLRPEWERDDLECVWVTIPAVGIGSSNDIHIAVAYIPPTSLITSRTQLLSDVVSVVKEQCPDDNLLVTGDFNLPCIDWSSGDPVVMKKGSVDVQKAATDLLTCFAYTGLSQYNYLQNSSNNVLDLFFSTFALQIKKSQYPLVKEDLYHPALSMSATDVFIPLLKPCSRLKFQYNRADFPAMDECFLKQDWSFIVSYNNLDDVVDTFYSILNNVINDFVPKVRTGGSYTYPCWYSRSLIKLIKEKNKLHTNWKKYRNQNDYEAFSKLRKRQKVLQDECLASFVTFSQEKIKSNPKAFWTYIKSKRKNATDYPKLMTYGDIQLNNPLNICSAFNDFFQRNFITSLTNNNCSAQCTCEEKLPSSFNLISDIVVSVDVVQNVIDNLDTNKGAGNDSLPPILFVKCVKSLVHPITLIFNRCFREGFFPSIWKEAQVIPIHKKGLKAAVENYRPISILNVLSKVMERIAHIHIYPIIALAIPSEQHGFMKGRSTATNLSTFTDYVATNMDGGSQVDVVYTDFEKAFDRVDHIILLRKLYELGIRGNLLRWLKSYLARRSQAVVVGGYCSNYIDITSGVPQGSILGPLLYACYLYDVGECVQHAKFLMYADDTKIFMKIKNESDCVKLQSDLDRLGEYYSKNRIGINVSKCHYVSFTRKRDPIQYDYELSSNAISKERIVRDLGLLLDHKLTYTAHIESIINKSYKSLGFIMRVCKPFSDIKCVKLLYHSYVRSILEYCSTIWSPSYVTYIRDIENIQHKFIKHLNYRAHKYSFSYEDSCEFHSITSLENRRTILDMAFLHGLCNGYIDNPILTSNVLSFCMPTTRTRHTKLFAVAQSRTNYAQNSIVRRLQKTYNTKFSKLTDIFHRKKGTFKRDVFDIIHDKCAK